MASIRHVTSNEAASLMASASYHVSLGAGGSGAVGGHGRHSVSVRMQEPCMPQGLAWHLALHALQHALRKQVLEGRVPQDPPMRPSSGNNLDEDRIHLDVQVGDHWGGGVLSVSAANSLGGTGILNLI